MSIFPPFPGTISDYHGYERHDFMVDGCDVIVVRPREAAPARPWIWRAEFFDHEPQADLALLGHGFHLVHMVVGNTFGAPSALAHWDPFYELLTTTYGLAPRVVLEGFSRGGLYCYNYAAKYPERVACIYGDAPVCDFKSWPAGVGEGTGSPTDWEELQRLYGFASEAEALAYQGNPIDNLAPLAAAGIPLLHVCGDADSAVPIGENTVILAQRYGALGGHIEVIMKPGVEHHPHSLEDPTPIVEFILRYAP
jgi:pimeloyl-ACP methyl ester carboxylesterase